MLMHTFALYFMLSCTSLYSMQNVQNLDDNESQIVSVNSLSQAESERQYTLVAANGDKIVCSERLLRHAGLFRAILDEDRLVEEINVGEQIASEWASGNNYDKVSLQNLNMILSYIEHSPNDIKRILPILFLSVPSLGLKRSNAWLMHAVQVAAYFDIPALFVVLEGYIKESIGEKEVNQEVLEALSGLPRDSQGHFVSFYIQRNNKRIMDFLRKPRTRQDDTISFDERYLKGLPPNILEILLIGRGLLNMRDGTPGLCTAWCQQRSMIALAFRGGRVEIWNTLTRKKLLILSGDSNSVASMDWSSDGSSLVTASAHSIRIHKIEYNQEQDAATSEEKLEEAICFKGILESTGKVTNIEWSPDNTKIAVTFEAGPLAYGCRGWLYPKQRGSCIVFGAHTGVVLHTLNEVDSVSSVKWSHNGKYVALNVSSWTSQGIHIWDIAQEKIIDEFTLPRETMYSMSWSFDNSEFITIHEDTYFELYHKYTRPIKFPDLFFLTLHQMKVIEKIILEKSFSALTTEENTTYQTLSQSWKNILSVRFADSSQGVASHV